MERGPVPPHERTWRHPSELAAQERLELRAVVAPRTTRVTALAAGTFGLIVVAALVLVVTPRDQSDPIAVSASTVASGDLDGNAGLGIAAPTSLGIDAGGADLLASAIGITGLGDSGQATTTTLPATVTTTTIATVTTLNTSTVDDVTVTTIVTSDVAMPSTTLAAILAALATPVGDGRHTLVTTRSIGGQTSGTVTIRLLSGDTASGEIVLQLDDTVVMISLPSPHTAHTIATEPPGHADMVTVMSDPSVDMTFGEIVHADVPEGTPVIDVRGGLVGLCSKRADGTTMVIDVAEVNDDLGGMATDTTVASTDTSTGAPVATAPPGSNASSD